MTNISANKKFFNMELAEALESQMNMPYSPNEGPYCSKCPQNGPYGFKLTGHIIDDGAGVYVEKECRNCGTCTDEGDSEFHAHYEIQDGEIISKHRYEIAPKRTLKVPKGTLSVVYHETGLKPHAGHSIVLIFKSEDAESDFEKQWSFGNEDWSKSVCVDWGDYVWDAITTAHLTHKQLDPCIEYLTAIYCEYNEPELHDDIKFMHLYNLDLIKKRIQSMKTKERHKESGVIGFMDFSFLLNQVTVLWKLKRHTQGGYVIELENYDKQTGKEELLHWSFGYEDSVEDISYAWGTYLVKELEKLQNEGGSLPDFLDRMRSINCTYELDKLEGERGYNLQDLSRIYELVGDDIGPSRPTKEESAPVGKIPVIIIVDGGIVQEVLTELDLDVTIIDQDTQDSDPLETIPMWGEERFVSEEFPITKKSGLQMKFIHDEIQKGKAAAETRKTQIALAEQTYDAAAYMVPFESGLTLGECKELFTYLHQEAELLTVDITENKTSIIGFKDESVEDNGEIFEALSEIAEDWTLHPSDNVVVTESGYKVILLERVKK